MGFYSVVTLDLEFILLIIAHIHSVNEIKTVSNHQTNLEVF